MEQVGASILTWLLLATAIVAAFSDIKQQRLMWFWPFVATIVSAVYFNQLTAIGVIWIVVGGTAALAMRRAKNLKIKLALNLTLVIWMIALAAHMLPGFNNLLVLNSVHASALSLPFTLYLNIDKPILFFVLLLMVPTLLMSNHCTVGSTEAVGDGQQNKVSPILLPILKQPKNRILLLMSLFVLLFIVATGAELIKPDIKVPDWWWLFVFNNLLFTCVAEEAFFRGFIQQALVKKYGAVFALLCTSMLFGVAHFAGGIAYVGVATIAGLLYGLAHYWYKNLLMPVLLHFLVNFVHLIVFTYPLAV